MEGSPANYGGMPEVFEALQTPSPGGSAPTAAAPLSPPSPSSHGNSLSESPAREVSYSPYNDAEEVPHPSGVISPGTPEDVARRRHEAAFDFVTCVKVKLASIRSRVVRLASSDAPSAIQSVLEEEVEVGTLLDEINALSRAMPEDRILGEQLSIAREDVEDLLVLVSNARSAQTSHQVSPIASPPMQTVDAASLLSEDVVVNVAARMGTDLRNLQSSVPRSWFSDQSPQTALSGLAALFSPIWGDAPQWQHAYLWSDEALAFILPHQYTPNMLVGPMGGPPQFYLQGESEIESPRSCGLVLQHLPPPVASSERSPRFGLQTPVPPPAAGAPVAPVPIPSPVAVSPPAPTVVPMSVPAVRTPPKQASPESYVEPRGASMEAEDMLVVIRVATRLNSGSGALVNFELPIPEYWLRETESVGEKLISSARLGSLLKQNWPNAPCEWRAVPHWWHHGRGGFVLEEPYDLKALGAQPQFYLLGIWEDDENSPRTRGLRLEELPQPLRVGDVERDAAAVASPPAEPTEPNWFDLFSLFYQKHNPAKVGNVPTLLEKYRHEERQLWNMLLDKYSLTADNWAASPKRQRQLPPRAVSPPAPVQTPQTQSAQKRPGSRVSTPQRGGSPRAARTPGTPPKRGSREVVSRTPQRSPAGQSVVEQSVPVGVAHNVGVNVAAVTAVGVAVPPVPYSVDWAARITDFYTQYNPGKVPKVPQLLRQFAGEEENLWIALQNQYCPNAALPTPVPAPPTPVAPREVVSPQQPVAPVVAANAQAGPKQKPRGKVGSVASPSRSSSAGTVPRRSVPVKEREEPVPVVQAQARNHSSLPTTAPLTMSAGSRSTSRTQQRPRATTPNSRRVQSAVSQAPPPPPPQRKPDVPKRTTTPTHSRRPSEGTGVTQPRWTSTNSDKVAEAARKLEKRKHQAGNPSGKIPNWGAVRPRTEAGKRKDRPTAHLSHPSSFTPPAEVEIPPPVQPRVRTPVREQREQAEVDDGMPNPLSPQHHDSEQRRTSPIAPLHADEESFGRYHEEDVEAEHTHHPTEEGVQLAPPMLSKEAIPQAVQRAMQVPVEVRPRDVLQQSPEPPLNPQGNVAVPSPQPVIPQQQQHQAIANPPAEVAPAAAPAAAAPKPAVPTQQPKKSFSKKTSRAAAPEEAGARGAGKTPLRGRSAAAMNRPDATPSVERKKRQFYVAPRPRSRTPNREPDLHERETGWKSPMTRGGGMGYTAMQRFEADIAERGFHREVEMERAEQMRKAEGKAMRILERQTQDAEVRNHRLEVLLHREEELERKRERIRLEREQRQRNTREWQLRRQPTSVHVASTQHHDTAPPIPPLYTSPENNHYDPSVPSWDPRAMQQQQEEALQHPAYHNGMVDARLYQQAHQLADDYENL